MKNLLLTILTLSFLQQATAQNAQEINVNVLQPLTFNYNTLDELSAPKTLYNALELDLKVKQVTALISASLNYTSPAEPSLANKLNLKYSNGNSSTAVINMADIPLGQVPVQLLQQPAFGNGVDHYTFYYNVTLQPITDFVTQTNNYFVLTFTLSNP
jgi:hypothetical protein